MSVGKGVARATGEGPRCRSPPVDASVSRPNAPGLGRIPASGAPAPPRRAPHASFAWGSRRRESTRDGRLERRDRHRQSRASKRSDRLTRPVGAQRAERARGSFHPSRVMKDPPAGKIPRTALVVSCPFGDRRKGRPEDDRLTFLSMQRRSAVISSSLGSSDAFCIDLLVSRPGGFLLGCNAQRAGVYAKATKLAQCAAPVAAGIGNTRKTGNKAVRHCSLAFVQETFGTGH